MNGFTTTRNQVHERQAARMRTRSEWFLGARGSSLELCHDGTGSLIHPQIVTSTPIPGAIGHGHHHPHGIIGTYDSVENLNDVDVIQDQENHHYYYHDKQSHHQHHHHHHPCHCNTHVPHHHITSLDVQKSATPRCTASNNEHTSSRNASNTSPVSLSNDRPPSSANVLPFFRGDSTLCPVQEQLPRRNPTFDADKIELYSDEDNNLAYDNDDDDDEDLTMMTHDEIDGDENDFAISQSHHFDMRAENRRRRRRRALLRRNSYDRIVASGSILPGDASCTEKSVGDRSGSSGLSGRRRPDSAPTTGEKKSNGRPTPKPPTLPPASHRSQGAGEHDMTNPNTVVTASTSLSNSNSVPNPTTSRRSLTAARQQDSSTLLGGRKIHHQQHHTGRRYSNVSHSISVGNGSSTTLSRQSNLSMIVFSVLDFLF
uniref:Uncharacterized protein n=1 Tax=Anopheles christyi TaxID=43041 RepID=A0A182KDZ9_9DIPT